MKRSARNSPRPLCSTRRGFSGRARWLTAGLIVLAGLLTGVAHLWMRHAMVVRIQAGLPTVPDLAGQPPEFGDSLERAVSATRSPDSAVDGAAELGRLYHANQFHGQAEACWHLLRSEQPENARWTYYLADLRRAVGDQSGMHALLEETVRLAPDYSPARLQLANLQFKSGDSRAALLNYQRRLDDVPHDPHARLGLVRLAIQDGRNAEARGHLESLVQDTPHFGTAHNLYAEILAAEGDVDGASRHRWLGQETLRFRAAEDPWLDDLHSWCFDYDRLCMLGTVEVLAERHPQAHSFFERAIRLKPYEPKAFELLAGLHLRLGKAELARDLLEQALSGLRTRPSPTCFATLSQAYRDLGQPAEAIRVARRGLSLTGAQPELYDALGLALADAGQHSEAVHAWHTGLAGKPGDASMNYNLAVSLLALGRLDDTLAALDRSLTLQPTFLPTLLLRGEIELQAGHLDLAEKCLRTAFESHPENPLARRLLGAWYARMAIKAETTGDAANAERLYVAGLAISPDHPELLVRLGVLYLTQKRFSEAIAPLASHHRLQPENARGCLFLGQAYAATGQPTQAREILTMGEQLAERSGNNATAERCRKLLQQL